MPASALQARRPRWSWVAGVALGAIALYPLLQRGVARLEQTRELEQLQAQLKHARTGPEAALDPALSLRAQRLSPFLASWETVGGCGAGSTSGTGSVKWIGHSTRGGLFQNITQLNYTPLETGMNLVLTTQFTRDIDDQLNVGVLIPIVYKRFDDYMGLPLDVANSGFGDINLLGTFRFGPIRETSLSLSFGIPTGKHDAMVRNDLLTQEKQLGLGRVTASLTLDYTLDQVWGVVVLGGLLNWRGGENELGSYRAPLASVYGYAGYFVGPLVPALGLALTGFPSPDRDRGIDQDVPLLSLSANASLEWSNDWVAVLAGISLPFGLHAQASEVGGATQAQKSRGLQPWTAALGVSVSPF